jgi:hypothetical protein
MMKPLPRDEKNRPVGNANRQDLILWLAYREAQVFDRVRRTHATSMGDVAPLPRETK